MVTIEKLRIESELAQLRKRWKEARDKGDLFIKIAECENRTLDPTKQGPTNDWGIFQIHYPSHKVPIKFLKNWKVNILIAKQLFDESGTNPWIASFNCWRK